MVYGENKGTQVLRVSPVTWVPPAQLDLPEPLAPLVMSVCKDRVDSLEILASREIQAFRVPQVHLA